MKIIPVLDLLNGQVVHGFGGKRKEYKPLTNSVLVNSSEPLDVAKAYREKLDLNWIYIADLNLIQNIDVGVNKLKIAQIVAEQTIDIMMDAGCKTIDNVTDILNQQIEQVIIGTETLASLDNLTKMVNVYGGEKIILSIDLFNGELLANNLPIQKYSVYDIVEFAENLSLKGLIVLELQKVGSQTGPISPTLMKIKDQVSNLNIFAGGGVRNITDLIELKENQFAGALIATAFHKGNITKEDLLKVL
ncbi:MAG TPA: HisA/HisF-related TIM barrel protein [Candidatus Bathyarchaeia archaeon]|nr:HisA/HisF-related TIM barrel protein [Candidatus Bathyarchaeia archaeon]